MPSSAKKILSSKYTAIVIILIISIGVYLNTLPNEFVYDDEILVLQNKWIKDIRYLPKIFFSDLWALEGSKEVFSNYYRPLIHIIYMIDYHIFGLKPWGFHLTNVIFHAGVSVLVFLIASILLGQILNPKSQILNPKSQIPKSQILNPAFIAAILFAVHPIQTETVACVAGIAEPSFALFYLLSFYFYIYSIGDLSLNRRGSCKSIEETASAVIPRFNRGIQTLSSDLIGGTILKNTGFPIKTSGMTNRDFCKNLRIKANGIRGKGFILSLIFFFLAALSKETALTLPILLFVYDYSLNRNSVYGPRFTVHSIFKRYLPHLIVTIIYFILRTYALGGFAPLKRHAELSNYEYFINVFPLFIQYLEKLILPINLNAFYVFHPISSILQWKGIIALILTLGFIFLIYFFRRHKVVFFCLLWIVIPLLPALYIPALGENTFGERYLYLPSAGFVMLTALSIERIYQLKVLRQSANFVIISILVILTGLYSLGTIERNYIWRDDYTLWTDTVKKSPDAYKPHVNLGNGYYEKKEIDKAVKHYQIAQKLKPNHPDTYYNLGLIYFEQGRFDEAINEYMTAIKVKPDHSEAHNNLGAVYFRQGRLDEAMKEYMTALKLNSVYTEAYYNLGLIYFKQGRFDEAIKEYNAALKLNPDYTQVYNSLGKVYFNKGEIDKAIEHFQGALRLKPDYLEAHYNLGLVYLKKGIKHQAEEEFKTALKLRPDFTPAREALESINRER